MSSGIYKIVNCVNPSEYYIGSAVKFSKRFLKHMSDLKKHIHHNCHLQKIYDEYGLDNLVFEIIEYVDNKVDIITREQYYIDTLNPRYNICKIAGSQLGQKRSDETKHKIGKASKGRKHTEETKLKISKAQKNMSEETKHKMSELRKGIKNMLGKKHSEKTKRKMSENNAKYWLGKKLSEKTILKKSKSFKLLSPQGQIVEGINISKFCRENNLHVGNMWQVINNKRKSNKGWTKST